MSWRSFWGIWWCWRWGCLCRCGGFSGSYLWVGAYVPHATMWPFNNNGDETAGCGNHHYPDTVENPTTTDVRVKRDRGYEIQTRETLRCQHEDCHVTTNEWVTHARLPSAAMGAHYRPEDYEDYDISEGELELAGSVATIHEVIKDNE